MSIKQNVGGIDRVLRAGIGSLMAFLGFFSDILSIDAFSSILIGTVGVVFVLTSIFGHCPLYGFIGFTTSVCKTPESKS